MGVRDGQDASQKWCVDIILRWTPQSGNSPCFLGGWHVRPITVQPFQQESTWKVTSQMDTQLYDCAVVHFVVGLDGTPAMTWKRVAVLEKSALSKTVSALERNINDTALVPVCGSAHKDKCSCTPNRCRASINAANCTALPCFSWFVAENISKSCSDECLSAAHDSGVVSRCN